LTGDSAANARRELGRLAGVLRALVLIVSTGYIALYAVLVCLRLRYPFELEWLEGASVDHVRTILAGRPLYARPSLAFIPLTYTPAYFYLGAALSKIIGVGFLPLRLISVASSVGVLVVTARLVWRETASAQAGVLAAGLFAAMFGWTGGWLDLARTDSLFLLLAMLTVYILRWRSSTIAMIVAGLLISLAFLTKQTGLIIAIPLGLWCALQGWRPFLAFAGTVFVSVVGTTLWLNHVFDGWYVYYLYAVPRQHPVAMQSVVGFWRYDLGAPLAVALVGSSVYLLWCLWSGDRRAAIFYSLVGVAFFAGAWVSRLHSLSFINVVLPAYLATAIVFGIAVHSSVRLAAARLSPHGQRWLGVAVYGLCLLQLIRLGYSPRSFVPTAQDVSAGQQLLQRIAETPGDVFVPSHGYLPALAGKATFAHGVVIADVIRGGQTSVEKALAAELDEALKRHQFDAVIVTESPNPVRAWLPIEEYYRPETRVVTVQSRFWRPEVRYVPK
jgi:Glycosyltransferase family 87